MVYWYLSGKAESYDPSPQITLSPRIEVDGDPKVSILIFVDLIRTKIAENTC